MLPVLILGAIAATGLTFTAPRVAALTTTTAFAASQEPAPAAQSQRRYKGTRRIIIDRQTGQLRAPTTEEVAEMVDTLKTLTRRPEELPSTALPGGAVAVDLDGGFAGVMLARANEDGSFETKCVFTFEEGAEFLGLVEETAAR